MEDYSKILWEAYNEYILQIGDHQIPTPYRINVPFQPDRRRYGKSNPYELLGNIKEIALENEFDLESASEEEITQFLKDQMLGIDCSGFVYHILNYLLKQIGKVGMEEVGFPPASKTNVVRLAEDDLSEKIDPGQIKPGDYIVMNHGGEIKHSMIILEVNNEVITYAHSSSPLGVHTAELEVKNGEIVFHEDLEDRTYQPDLGDGVRRLKALL